MATIVIGSRKAVVDCVLMVLLLPLLLNKNLLKHIISINSYTRLHPNIIYTLEGFNPHVGLKSNIVIIITYITFTRCRNIRNIILHRNLRFTTFRFTTFTSKGCFYFIGIIRNIYIKSI